MPIKNQALRRAEQWERLAGTTATADTTRNFRERIITAMTAANFGNVQSVIYVTQASDLAPPLDSTKLYFIDGQIDMGALSIEVPAGGLSLGGWSFDISGLYSSEDNYTMFTSPVGGSGNVLGKDYFVSVTGTNSKVYDLVDATGFNAFEFQRINYNNCGPLGVLDGYRQGLEVGTGRFGGSPSLELKGTWIGGYLVDTSIVRSLDAGMTEPLFKAGAGFTMGSRFKSNMNIDLPASAAFLDFAPANFLNPSTLQLQDMIVTRNGVSNPEDANLTPNIDRTALASAWGNNVGLPNTFPGGKAEMTAEAATSITVQSQFEDIAGTFTASELQHFDNPANGQLRHLGNNPRDYRLEGDLIIDGPSNAEVSLKLVKWDDSAAGFVDLVTFSRQVNAFVGGRDVAFFQPIAVFTLDQNDYIKLQVANDTSTADLTVENGSFYIVSDR